MTTENAIINNDSTDLKASVLVMGREKKKDAHKVIHETAAIGSLLKVSQLFPPAIKVHFQVAFRVCSLLRSHC